jgi:primosomal protein N' (replication factor Y)
MVRIPLHGRRVGGWVLDDRSEPPEGVRLSEIAKVTGIGPDADVIDLCRWATWRWAARLATLLRVASPDRAVPVAPPLRPRPVTPGREVGPDATTAALAREALDAGAGVHVLQVPPTADAATVALAAAARGQALVVVPAVWTMEHVGRTLRRAGAFAARWPRDYAQAVAGATVVGGRGAVFAPLPALAAVVVWDEHDEGLQNESSPTWHAREVAVERARRAGVPCLLVSPCPSLEARSAGAVLRAPRSAERAGWGTPVVVDRRDEDVARSRLYSPGFVDAARHALDLGGRVVCVLNRTGRARLLACRSCGTVTECERCGAAVHLTDRLELRCDRCDTSRPTVCLECGSTALGLLRPGVTRAAEELAALLGEDVATVTATTAPEDPASARGRVLIGTEAVLHRVRDAALVAFLDLDQELLAPRYRAAEEALALVVLAARIVGGRVDAGGGSGGRVLVQTRRPDHEVVEALVHADPDRVARAESQRRSLLRFPPAAAVALVAGEAAPAYVERLGSPLGVEVLHPEPDRWLLRADDAAVLLDALAAVDRPPGRLRLQVDPARLR